MIDTQSKSCSSVITKGGANLILLPCVGLAKRPLFFRAIQISQANEEFSLSLIIIALSKPLPLTPIIPTDYKLFSLLGPHEIIYGFAIFVLIQIIKTTNHN